MKKIITIVSGVIIAGSITVWKTIDNKVLKKADEVITQTAKYGMLKPNKNIKIINETTEEVLKNNPLKVKVF